MRIRSVTFLILVLILLLTGSIPAQNVVISLDNVTYEYTPTQLMAGGVHKVSINFDFTGAPDPGYWMGAAAFEVYSPDGADWSYLQGSAGPLVQTAGDRGSLSVFERYRTTSSRWDVNSWTPTGNDGSDPAGGSTGPNSAAAFYVATLSLLSDAGFIGGVDNGIGMEFTFLTLLADYGLTMCIDTVSTSSVVYWEWAAPGVQDFPVWDNGLGVSGPRCWEVYQCPCGCCVMHAGDANGVGGDEPTISDVNAMIDAKFITGSCEGVIACIQEADLNHSGGDWPDCDDITIGDISILIDYLFITGSEMDLPMCWWWSHY